MKGESVVIILPLPPRQLSPNLPCGSRKGRIVRAIAAREYKAKAKTATMEARVSGWERATVRVRFYHKTKRRRDDVNHLAMLKPAYDGIIQAGLLPDDDAEHLRTAGAEFFIDKNFPRVEIEFVREE